MSTVLGLCMPSIAHLVLLRHGCPATDIWQELLPSPPAALLLMAQPQCLLPLLHWGRLAYARAYESESLILIAHRPLASPPVPCSKRKAIPLGWLLQPELD